MAAALDSVRILDFSRVLAGPFATMVLADLGAEVTKVERPGGGDETRAWGPPFDTSGNATYFQSVNRNKRSVALDLRAERDAARARELAREADSVVENFRPGVMESFGLGYEQLRAENPGLIFCSITGFGREGGAGLPGYDLLLQALGGLMSITGDPRSEPQKVGVALVDVLAGLFASVGILAALRHRDAGGGGQRVDVDLLSSLLAALVNQGAAYTVAGVIPGRMGNAHPSIAPYELLRTGSGELVLAVGNERQFAALCETIGAAELAADPRFLTNRDRVENRTELREELERRLRAEQAAVWVERLKAVAVPAGEVNDIGAAFRLAETLGLEPRVRVPGPGGEEVELTASPINLSATPPSYRSAPPPLPPHEPG
jgi:crotonobetainyl-CoA:carnitine CoA-transferase CaiB-like acyl-CoA transferase